ncbi:MAG: hypothetical protein ACXW28_13145 [Thermoanaerobaculia bacterium]
MKTRKNALEWTVFGVSAVIIAMTVALLAGSAVRSKERGAPDLRIETGAPIRSSDGHTVPVVVSNRGDVTAEQARVEIALVADGEEVEKAELTIAFVPQKSRRAGAVVFRRDPRCCVITARTVAYEEP